MIQGQNILGDYYRPATTRNDLVLPRYAPLSAIESDAYNETTWGHVALAGAGGIAIGILMGYAWGKSRRGK